MIRDRVFKIAIIITGILLLLILMISAEDGFSSVAMPEKGLLYQIYEEERIPRTEVDELMAVDGMLYLYYEDFGLVNVYSTEGGYQWSYQVAPGKNGIGGIGYADGVFYLRSKVNGVFGFQRTELASSVIPNEDAIVDEPNPVTDGGYTYYYNAEANRVERNKPGKPLETVVQLPKQNANVTALLFVIGALWIAFSIWDKVYMRR